MKKLVLAALLPLIFSNIWAEQLPNFKDIQQAISSGKSIHVVTYLDACTPALPNFNASYTPSSLIMTSQAILFSDNHFTDNNPQYSGQPVYEFVSYKLTSDETLSLTSQVITLPNYQVQSPFVTTSCQLNKGVKFFAD